MGMVLERAFFQGFASAQAVLVQQLDDDAYADSQGACLHGITRRVGTDNLQEGGIKVREQTQTGFSATPFFRDRPGGRKLSSWSSAIPRRIVFGSQAKRLVR